MEIIVLNSTHESSYSIINSFSLKYKSSISDFKLSYHEKLIAIALAPSSDSNAKIELFELDNET